MLCCEHFKSLLELEALALAYTIIKNALDFQLTRIIAFVRHARINFQFCFLLILNAKSAPRHVGLAWLGLVCEFLCVSVCMLVTG